MKMKRKRRNRRDKMEAMAFINAITRFRRFVQYFVTLNTRNNRRALSADNPNLFDLSWKFTQNTSNTDPKITMVSNLKDENIDQLKVDFPHHL